MAFENLSERLQNAIKMFRGSGKIREDDLKAPLREVRMALLEADVNFKVVKDFVANIKERALGETVQQSLTPGQQIIKIVNDELTQLLGGTQSKLTVADKPPTVIMLVGLQGAGKTTTLKAVVGILPFDEGSIEVDGFDISEEPMEVKKRIAYIPDEPKLYETQTGAQYLNFIADIFGVSAAARQQKIEKYAGLLEIRKALNDPINSYSHGMKQKLQIISAFIHEPKLMVMDEPFVGLDPKAAFTFKQLMREFCEQGGAIFFSTHVLEVAEKLCDKVAVIKGGKLIASGTMEEVKGDNSLEEVFLELTEHE